MDIFISHLQKGSDLYYSLWAEYLELEKKDLSVQTIIQELYMHTSASHKQVLEFLNMEHPIVEQTS